MENQFGKVSRLTLEASVKDGKTILSDVAFTAPFKVMRPFYEKGTMEVMLLTASAGIMSGDQQEFQIHVKEGADMKFLSQAYEKIHRMEEGYASRRAEITVEAGARFCYTPLPTIPFCDSDYRSEVEVRLADGSSRFIMTEVLTCGRVAYGESFLYRNYQNRVRIWQGGQLVYYDNTRYQPQQTDMTGFGMYEGFTHLANIVICNEPKDSAWIGAVRELIDEQPEMEGGVTQTAYGHTVVRILGMSGQKLTEIQEKILRNVVPCDIIKDIKKG